MMCLAPTLSTCPACGDAVTRIRYARRYQDRHWALAQCPSCRQQFTSPTPTDEDLSGFYAGDYHAQLRYEEQTEAAFGGKYRRYAAMLGRHLRAGRVVDVGCSTGLLVRMLRDCGYHAEGIEMNQRSAAWGRAHYDVTIHTDPLERCGYAPESLNAVLMTDVLEHTRHPRDFLRDVGQLLVPGGIVLVTFPDISSLESRYQHLLSRLLRRDWIWSACHIPLHVWEFTPTTAEACFAGAGFNIVEFRRSQAPAESNRSLTLKLLESPLRVLSIPFVARRWGTQMEFVIQKR